MKFATAIIVASCRVSRAMPFEMPENPAATKPAATSVTARPTTPPFVAPSARPTARMMNACTTAIEADVTMRE